MNRGDTVGPPFMAGPSQKEEGDMSKMNPMDVVVKILEDEGVDYVFGVPGAAILPLYKALSKSEHIKNISVRHEEGGTHAADGYARATVKVAISIGTSTP